MNHSGIPYLIDGFQLIFKPGLKRFVIIPFLINMLLFAGLFFVAQHFFHIFSFWVETFLPSWLMWLSGILWFTFFIGFFLVFIYTFVTLANLIAAPFNSFLAEKVEFYLTGNLTVQKTWQENMKDVPRIIGRQLAILGYYIPRALVLLILFFIPLVQLIAAPLWFCFNAWFMTLQYLDYPTDGHKIPLANVHAWLWQHRLLSFSFGASVLFVTAIPILNFLVVPAAVAGATKMWVEEGN